MKVGELIQELKKYPPHKEVVIRDADEVYTLLYVQGLDVHPEYVALSGCYDKCFEPEDEQWYQEDHYEEIKFS